MVSVIIPIYNVRKFIKRGLRNVLAQTYQDFEILLSDDGSTDSSYEECQMWASKDSRIRVLHQENKGAGAARNHGIDEAKGEFIYFFDIDDEIKPNLLEYCVEKMDELNVDFICFGYENVETTYNSKVIVDFPETIITSNSDFRDLYVDQFVMKVNGFPWNKFYRKSFLNKHYLRYEDQRIQQDEVFNLKCYRYLEKAYLSPEVLYTYYVYEKGNTRSRFIPDRFDFYVSVRDHFKDIGRHWHIDDSRFENYLNRRFYYSIDNALRFNLLHPDCPWSRKEKNNEIKKVMSHPYTQEAMVWAKQNLGGLENRMYLQAYQNKCLCLITLYSSFFSLLRKMKHKIAK